MPKDDTLSTIIAGEAVSVAVVFEEVASSHVTIRVNTRDEALLVCYCYREQRSRIERAADGGFFVVVLK